MTDGRSTRWESHRLQRRGAIVAAAVLAHEEQGTEVHVHDIAARAGVTRAVVYRHFKDRADLDTAVQEHVLGLLREALEPTVVLVGTPREIINRLVTAYVDWVAEHPNLHRLAQRGRVSGARSAYGALVTGTASRLDELVALALTALGVELEEGEEGLRVAITAGLMSLAYGAVHRWLGLAERPPATELAAALSDTIWFALDGHLRARGVVVDPDAPLQM